VGATGAIPLGRVGAVGAVLIGPAGATGAVPPGRVGAIGAMLIGPAGATSAMLTAIRTDRPTLHLSVSAGGGRK
jgi:hypothetical protein